MAEPTYPCKLLGIEAFVLVQLLDSSVIKGVQAENIYKLRQKLQRLLEGHHKKTGEYIGYGPPDSSPPGMPPTQPPPSAVTNGS